MDEVDYLIVGDGLAGLVLAWTLRRAGVRVRLFCGDRKRSASRVAAGVLNPVTGKRLAAGWELEAQMAAAFETYRAMETELGIQVLRAIPLHRFFLDASEVKFHAQRFEEARYRAFLSPVLDAPGPGTAGVTCFKRPGDFFTISGAGHLEIPPLLDALVASFRESGAIEAAAFNYERLDTSGADLELVYDDRIRAKAVVFCEGIGVYENPWFRKLRFRPVKGEALTFESRDLRLPEAVYHHEKWILPVADSRYRLGSTYDRGISPGEGFTTLRPDAFSPSEAGRRELLESLERMFVSPPDAAVVEHRAGVRPATRDRFPYVGPHPDDARLLVLNGLGSKGALWAPWLSWLLCDYLLQRRALPKELNPGRYPLGS